MPSSSQISISVAPSTTWQTNGSDRASVTTKDDRTTFGSSASPTANSGFSTPPRDCRHLIGLDSEIDTPKKLEIYSRLQTREAIREKGRKLYLYHLDTTTLLATPCRLTQTDVEAKKGCLLFLTSDPSGGSPHVDTYILDSENYYVLDFGHERLRVRESDDTTCFWIKRWEEKGSLKRGDDHSWVVTEPNFTVIRDVEDKGHHKGPFQRLPTLD